MLATLKLRQMGVSVKLFGGYDHAERQMAAFYPGTVGFSWEYPIDCLKITPKALRFSEELGHRDYLGAILNLGVDRSVVGDILIKDKEAWVFCLHKMSDFFYRQSGPRAAHHCACYQGRAGRGNSRTAV